jgi:VanZ family protein
MSALLRRFWPALLYAGAIWIVGGLRNTPHAPSGLGLDKVAHFLMYGGLGYLLGRGWAVAGRGMGWVVPVLLALLLGAADELRQAALPTRSAELADWFADAAGITLGFLLALRGARRTRHDERHERE